MSFSNLSSSKIPVLFEIQEALLSTLYPIKPAAPMHRTIQQQYMNQGPCCNCKCEDGLFGKTVFWIEKIWTTEWYPTWIWLHNYYGSVNEPHHYFSNQLCRDCAYAVKEFIQDNIIASFNVTLKQFDLICTFFPHELNRIVLQYTNPLLR